MAYWISDVIFTNRRRSKNNFDDLFAENVKKLFRWNETFVRYLSIASEFDSAPSGGLSLDWRLCMACFLFCNCVVLSEKWNYFLYD